jgi:hypothetical protein
VRYEVAGVVRPSPSMLLLPIELLQLSCGFALESVLTPLIEFPQGWLPTMGSDEDDEVIVSNGSSSTSAAVTVAAGAASGTSVGVRATMSGSNDIPTSERRRLGLAEISRRSD